jgi:Tol biopolymer transport system component
MPADNASGSLLEAPVTDFAFSPNGRRLTFAMDDPDVPGVSLWQANLASGAVVRSGVFDSATGVTVFAGGATHYGIERPRLARKGRVLVEGSPEQILNYKDQWSSSPCLFYVHRPIPKSPGTFLRYPTARATIKRASPGDRETVAGGCSPKGDFIAEIGASPGAGVDARRMFLARTDGTFVQDLTDGVGYADEYPLWGPVGSGIVFVRRPASGGDPQVWYLAEGARAAYTGLNVTDLRSRHGHFSWNRVLDWSADQPTGTTTD